MRKSLSLSVFMDYGGEEGPLYWCTVFAEDANGQVRFHASTGTRMRLGDALVDGLERCRSVAALKDLEEVLSQIKR